MSPDGRKYWRFIAGKEKLISVGVYPQVRSAEAREQRDEAKRLLKAGSDPSAPRQARKLAGKMAKLNTFEAVDLQWIKQQEIAGPRTTRCG